MELRYADRKLERACTDSRRMQKAYGAQISKALQMRLVELRRVETIGDVLLGTGKWEELVGDRAGQWAAHLSRNWRLIVQPDGPDAVTVLIVEIVDYH